MAKRALQVRFQIISLLLFFGFRGKAQPCPAYTEHVGRTDYFDQ